MPGDVYVRIERFSLLDDYPDLEGQRLSIMAHVTSPTLDGGTTQMNVAIASFLIGRDFDQSCDLIIAPTDKCTLGVVGPDVPVQIIYSKFPV